MEQDIRWQQRFSNYKKALSQMEKFVKKGDALNELELQGMIKSFEYTFELAWNTMKDYFQQLGEQELFGSRDTIRLAFKRNVIVNGQTWMDMLKDRNNSVHAYDEVVAGMIAKNILANYYPEFVELKVRLEDIMKSQIGLFGN